MGIVNSVINYLYYYNNIKNDSEKKSKNIEKEWIYPNDFFCPICINTLNENNNKTMGSFWIKFDCNHYIHYKCMYEFLISKMYNKKCPLCKKELIVKNKNIESNVELFKFYCKIIIQKE